MVMLVTGLILILKQLVTESSNSNIDLEAVATFEDELYLSILTVTKEPLFSHPMGILLEYL